MLWNRRSQHVPDDVRRALPLGKGEHVLAGAADRRGQWIVATDAAVIVDGRRIPWLDIAKAGWDDDARALTIETLSVAGQPSEVLRHEIDEPGAVPETVRERVEDSIVATRRVRVGSSAGLRVVARKSPREDELVWQVVLDRGLDPADAQVQARADEAVADLKRELGV